MGKKGGEAPPPAPDPYATARAQTSSNVSTSIANAVMGNAWETSPLGTVRYQQRGNYTMSEPILDKNGQPTTTQRWVADPGTNTPAPPMVGVSTQSNGGAPIWDPMAMNGQYQNAPGGHWETTQAMSTRDLPIWERITELSPEQQALYQGQTKAQQQLLDFANEQIPMLRDTLGRPIDLSGLPQVPLDTNAYRQQVEDAMFARMNPQLERDRAALENTLVNQGFQRGTEAFNQQMDSFGRQTNDARNQVFLASANEARAQQDQQATARERALQELLLQRQEPINEISSLLGQSQVQMPQFSPFKASPMSETPVGDYVYRSADINSRNWQAQQQMNAQSRAGMFGLGSSLLGGLFKIGSISDRRMKTGIKRIGVADNGLPIYSFQYKWGGPTQIGFMADEVEKVHPEAVIDIDGIKRVRYDIAASPVETHTISLRSGEWDVVDSVTFDGAANEQGPTQAAAE